MSNNNNYTDNDNDIRSPDGVIKEQLNENPMSDYEQQQEDAIYWSLLEFNEQKELNEKYEQELQENHLREISIRKNKFKDLLNDLKKLIHLDYEIKNIYEIIEPVIESYSGRYIESVEFDEITYDKIFKELGKIRTDKKNIENLKTIILKE
jgi:hypothetical protein